ncbi:ATP-binding protein [Azospirillum sp. TSO22-1]|uniref:hybrid sensor histidine kinase/response regulator n=1 Tax=Azospirillum sp. TSO22-1 TaxID=716789 RepID=UPI000D65D4DA|nr:ATP-binding protein [Azospirillum sp. TSO22-1]
MSGVRKVGTYAALLAGVVLFVASLGIAGARLHRIEQDIAKDFGENVTWAVSQSELELMRFLAALDRAGKTAAEGELARRFDLLWSRVALLREGELAARLDTVDGARRTVEDAAAALADLDPLLSRLNPAAATDVAEVERRLAPLVPRLHEAAVWTMQSELDRLASRSEERRSAMLEVFAHFVALVVSGGVLTLLLIREIRGTQRLTAAARLAETEARASEQRFRDIVEAASDWVWETGPDHRLTFVSEQMTELSGEEPRDVLGRTRMDMRLPDDGDDANWTAHLATLDARQPFRDFVFPYHDRAGRRRFCRIHGKPVFSADGRFAGYRGTGSDITERVLAEQTLKDSEDRFRSIAEGVPLPVMIARMDEPVILFANARATETFGLRAGSGTEAIRACYRQPDDRDRLLALVGRVGRTDAFEAELRRADGQPFWALLSSRTLVYKGEAAIMTAVTDIADRKRTEAEIAQQRERLHQSEKLAALGSLLAGVAHELNNPLSVVVGHATMLQELAPDAASRARAGKIKAAAERCARIVRTFLSMARKKPQERGPVRLDAVIDGVLEILAYGLRTSGIEVVRAIEPALPQVFGNADQLHQVFMNLIVNAQQAMQGHPPPRRLRVAARVDGGDIRVEIADNGPGIPPDIVMRIFDPFFTTKPLGLGTGIGLSVCHGIVEGHGGGVEVDSRPGQGATFIVRLPLSDAAIQPIAVTQALAPPGRTARILVVDDEPDVGELLAEMLAHAGHEATVVSNGRAALDWLAGQPTDLIISDLRMPEMDGATLYRELAARRPELTERILFITGDSLSSDLMQFLADTGASVIEKPYDLQDVARQVESKLALKQLNQ